MYILVEKSKVPSLPVRGLVRISPRRLLLRFGEPGPGTADDKVSGSYLFRSTEELLVCIYDWKCTARSARDINAGLPIPNVFWTSTSLADLTVLADVGMNLQHFAKWLGANALKPTHEDWLDL